MFCGKCGAQNLENATFCKECGAPLNSTSSISTGSDKAMYYLHLAAEHGNQYAAQLIHSIRVNGNWTAALASLRLLGHIARVIQNRLEDERRGRENSIDRKLRRKIEEKKQAHGLKQ